MVDGPAQPTGERVAVPMEAVEQTPFRAVDDVGIRVPVGMALPLDPDLAAIVAETAGLTRGAGVVMAAQEIAAKPDSTLLTIMAVTKLLVFGRAQQTIDEVTGSGVALGCKSGCAWCCYQSVEATIPEAILIALQLADTADPRRAAIRANAARFRGLSERERRRTGTPCALLGPDRRCTAYDNRPLMCRGMMAVKEEQCRAAHAAGLEGEAEPPLELFINAQYFILGDQAALRGILRDMGLQDDPIELTQAVAAFLEDPTLIDRWLNRERIFGAEMMPPQPEKRAAEMAPAG
jgi:Fe-S-cluster containining protein